jgi:hypothetical protein
VSPSLRRPFSSSRSSEEPAPPAPADSPPETENPKPTGKGRPTPKRREAEKRRRGPVAPPPATRKEAAARRKEEAKAERAAAREGLSRGDTRYLPKRDRGPERALVRDLIDSRRTASTLFLPTAILIIVASLVPNPTLQRFAYLLWLFVLISIIIDSVVLGRLVKRRVREEFPESRERGRGLVFYAVTRAIQLRRLRFPKPVVKVGERV